MLCDVLIENNKYGCVTMKGMQNNGAMKIVNFMHAQMAKVRHFSAVHECWVQG